VARSLRLFTVTALLVAGTAAAAGAQAPTPRFGPEASHLRRPPYSYFKYRVPRMSVMVAPSIRLHRDELHLRLERSLQRMDRLRERHFDLRDRAWHRQLETQERSMSRLQERMVRLRAVRPLRFRRHLRTI
jgi:hypothetical protein